MNDYSSKQDVPPLKCRITDRRGERWIQARGELSRNDLFRIPSVFAGVAGNFPVCGYVIHLSSFTGRPIRVPAFARQTESVQGQDLRRM